MSFRNNAFEIVRYMAFGGTGTGMSAQDPLPLTAGDLASLEQDMVVTDSHIHVTTAIVGPTSIDIGDGTDTNGYIAAPALTVGSVIGAGVLATGAYKVPADDAAKLAVTGAAATAGAAVVVMRGYKV